jgi:transcriptional regulator GlxA family with amidase domain
MRTLKTAVEVADVREGRITAYDLSVAAGVSQRTLEYAFQMHLGTTPGRYLRALRLNGVRRELRQGDPTTTTVSRVALKWSFYHAGRFSALYRSQFGELPGQTLRRVRPSRHFVLENLIETETAATA